MCITDLLRYLCLFKKQLHYCHLTFSYHQLLSVWCTLDLGRFSALSQHTPVCDDCVQSRTGCCKNRCLWMGVLRSLRWVQFVVPVWVVLLCRCQVQKVGVAVKTTRHRVALSLMPSHQRFTQTLSIYCSLWPHQTYLSGITRDRTCARVLQHSKGCGPPCTCVSCWHYWIVLWRSRGALQYCHVGAKSCKFDLRFYLCSHAVNWGQVKGLRLLFRSWRIRLFFMHVLFELSCQFPPFEV